MMTLQLPGYSTTSPALSALAKLPRVRIKLHIYEVPAVMLCKRAYEIRDLMGYGVGPQRTLLFQQTRPYVYTVL